MGISERKQRQKDLVRESILKAAWKIVIEQGWASFSLRNIAEAIEFSTPVIYAHFPNKEAIVIEFYKQGLSMLLKDLQKVADQHPNPEKRLHAIGLAYWEFAFTHKEYYQIMFGVNMQCCYPEEHLIEKKKVIEFLHQHVKETLDYFKNTEADPSLKRSTFWSILHGLVSINITTRILKEEGKTEKVLNDAIMAFINSCKGQTVSHLF